MENFLGVYRKRNKWQAKISYRGRKIAVGDFDTADEAAKNRDYHMLQLHGKPKLNFPDFDYTGFKPKRKKLGPRPKKKQKPRKKRLGRQAAEKIRSLYNTRKYTQVALAKQYGVTPSTIGRIVHNINYHTPRPLGTGSAKVSVQYNPYGSRY